LSRVRWSPALARLWSSKESPGRLLAKLRDHPVFCWRRGI
jgi:hypothetical protein